jgi:predicted nucleic acid-binding protein
MKKRVYIETTVVSYFTAQPSRDLLIAGHQEATRELWSRLAEDYETYISALVYEEARRGDPGQSRMRLRAVKPFRMLDIDEDARALAERIISGRAIPGEHPEDALHLAVAAVNGMEILITWNFAHLNNPFTRGRVRQVVESEGYRCPEICSPDELLEVDQ